MDILIETNGSKGAFFIEKHGQRLASMEFTMAGADKMIIDHTEVDETLKGTGAGRKLLNRLVEYARGHEIKVIPLCPFAHSVFKKDAEIRDVLLSPL